ncbi:MAG: hypothetical protein AEth_00247 [Candidatus Argoarchaeum ethanivorans]|uniref:Uncharacterized protein n=1 Tax=Candidatus Argoarchaeum ethanivorans TaxID=2608793 RepID=A0A8B3S4U2_9EURY|nr:MAG: hypothetical protein AEth_00247 [Candidatus Argoarchaeum ethanivorans]
MIMNISGTVQQNIFHGGQFKAGNDVTQIAKRTVIGFCTIWPRMLVSMKNADVENINWSWITSMLKESHFTGIQ